MFEKEIINKLDDLIKTKFPQILNFKFDGIILLIGGAIKDVIMDKTIKDLDFTLLTNGKGNVLEFIKHNNFKYKKNKYRGYKIIHKNIEIDIDTANDLLDVGHLNTDFLFYDVMRKQLIPIGIKQAINKKIIYEYYYQGYKIPQKRIKKAKDFINFMNSNKKRTTVIRCYFRPFKLLKGIIKRINFRRNNEQNKITK